MTAQPRRRLPRPPRGRGRLGTYIIAAGQTEEDILAGKIEDIADRLQAGTATASYSGSSFMLTLFDTQN
jgi:hypothetical protein